MNETLLVAFLEATPRLLRAVAECPASLTWSRPRPEDWSIGDVVRHVVHGDRDTFLPRLRRMLAEERPVFEPRSPLVTDGEDVPRLLAIFESARREVVALLTGSTGHAWRREGISPSRGPLTVAEYARTMVAHDTEHLQQLQDLRETFGLLPKRAEARRALALGDIASAIAHTPSRVQAVSDGLTPADLRRRPRDPEWSMKEVMAHLLAVERDVFLPRLRRMLDEHEPRFPRFDAGAWAASRDHREGVFSEDYEAFVNARRDTAAFLRSLPEGVDTRLGFSSVYGPITLGQYATHVLDHDEEHLAQLRDVRHVLAAGS